MTTTIDLKEEVEYVWRSPLLKRNCIRGEGRGGVEREQGSGIRGLEERWRKEGEWVKKYKDRHPESQGD
jgi:hypothetical protein